MKFSLITCFSLFWLCTSVLFARDQDTSHPKVSAGTYKAMCADNAPIQLFGTPAGGYYTEPDQILAVVYGYFYPGIAGPGKHWVYYIYTYSDSTTGTDSTLITVWPKPIFTRFLDTATCIFGNSFLLPDQYAPHGLKVTWNGNQVTDSFFDTKKAKTGIDTVFYSVTDSNGCSNGDTGYIRVDSFIEINFITDHDSGNVPLTVSILNHLTLKYPSADFENIEMDFGDGEKTYRSYFDDTIKHTYKDTGWFNVSLTVRTIGGCGNTIAKPRFIHVLPHIHTSGIEDGIIEKKQVCIFPNPGNDKLNIDFGRNSAGLCNIVLLIQDQLGKTVKTIQLSSVKTEVDTRDLKPGIYNLKFQSGTGGFNSRWIKN